MPDQTNPFNARATLKTALGDRTIYRLDALKDLGDVDKLPYTIKVLLEACLRNVDGFVVTDESVKALVEYDAKDVGEVEIPFKPGRVVLQDFTGVPAVVDLAAMRSGIVRMTGDESTAEKVNPLVPCDLVIDHSVQVDAFGSDTALTINSQKEFERNKERYEFLKWGQKAFKNFSVVPPATGIVHQVNLEYLAKVVWDGAGVPGQEDALYPDSLVGTDSHTTMINGLGVLGWGVGGIEAEAVMVGQPIYMLIPEVVGLQTHGQARRGLHRDRPGAARHRDAARARRGGQVRRVPRPGPRDDAAGQPGDDRQHGARVRCDVGFFPVDDETLKYMRLSGRDENLVAAVEQYCKEQGLWRSDEHDIVYTDQLALDMSTVEPALAGPKRPQDRIALSAMKSQWLQDLSATFGKVSPSSDSTPQKFADEGGQSAPVTEGEEMVAVADAVDPGYEGVDVEFAGEKFKLKHGAVVIAAITSCTNTSNPGVMLGAGLVAKKAREKGLTTKPWVKTSLAPGSKVVTDYLAKAELQDDLDALGFNLVGYGCTTCIGNSGPLPEPISKAINQHDLVATSVLSGNRNFEGRISPDVKANYLASPPLVVAYALAGSTNIDLTHQPIGKGSDGEDVYLKDIWPTQDEVNAVVSKCVTREQFIEQYADVFAGSDEWQAIESSTGALYGWSDESTYIQEPPFFVDLTPDVKPIEAISGARCLVKVGDSVTTDHISPAGSIKVDSPAGEYLVDHDVPISMFNSYGSRRGNDRVMTRGTFANIRVRNQLAPGTEGGWTTDFTDGLVKPIYDASLSYKEEGTPLVVLAGKDYGMGSSRDWAAKGTFLLGVRAVIAESFERIHRSNLVGMGVLPLVFKDGDSAASLGLTGKESFAIEIDDSVKPRQDIKVTATAEDGKTTAFTTVCRIDTPVEVDYYRNGGILHTVLRKMAQG